MVKDHSDSEKGNPLPPHRLHFRLTARVLLYAPSHRQDSTSHGLCYTSRAALAGTRNTSMGPPHEGSIRRPTAPWANALPLSYVSLQASSSLPLEERTCPMCKSILIEDEFHVLMKCPLYDDLRYPLFLEANFLYNDFDQMTEQDLFYVGFSFFFFFFFFLAIHVCLF